MDGGDALSEVVREKTQKWFTETLHQRGDDDKTKFIVVMQRLHEDDLAGFLIRKGGWQELRLSAIATEDERVPLTRGRFHQRRVGGVLSPATRSKAWLERKKASEPYVFASVPARSRWSHRRVMPEWFGTYDIPPTSGPITISMDTAYKTTVRSDWSVAIVSLWYGGRHYILDICGLR